MFDNFGFFFSLFLFLFFFVLFVCSFVFCFRFCLFFLKKLTFWPKSDSLSFWSKFSKKKYYELSEKTFPTYINVFRIFELLLLLF